jgi:hypothetical protein
VGIGQVDPKWAVTTPIFVRALPICLRNCRTNMSMVISGLVWQFAPAGPGTHIASGHATPPRTLGGAADGRFLGLSLFSSADAGHPYAAAAGRFLGGPISLDGGEVLPGFGMIALANGEL